MAAEGWQDDARFATSLARMRAGSGYGPMRIRAELGTHGLDEVVIVQAFAALAEAGEDDWRRQARNLVRRRFGDDFTRDLALRRKAADFLMRRGFDGGPIRRASRDDTDFDGAAGTGGRDEAVTGPSACTCDVVGWTSGPHYGMGGTEG